MIEICKKYGGEILGYLENPSVEKVQEFIANHLKSIVDNVEVVDVDESNFDSDYCIGNLGVVLNNGFQMVYDCRYTPRKIFGRDFDIVTDRFDCGFTLLIQDIDAEHIKQKLLENDNIEIAINKSDVWDNPFGNKNDVIVIDVQRSKLENIVIEYLNNL